VRENEKQKNLRERIVCEKSKCMREKIDRFEIGRRWNLRVRDS